MVGGEVEGLKGINENGVKSEDKDTFVRSFSILGKVA